MPATPRVRVDGYVRVSRVNKRRGPRFISPAVQREAIEEWAACRGFELAEVFEELDVSGARADRPLLELAIRRLEYRATSALVVWRVDRFGRNLDDGVRIIRRIRAIGGGFYSVQDGLDISTDAGRLALRILLSVAEFNLDGIREAWDTARERAVHRGVYPQIVPVGYRKTRTGRLRPHPTTGPIMTQVYRRRAGGEALKSLCRFLEGSEVRTAWDNPGWTPTTLKHLLNSRVYLGEIRSGSFVNERAHPPLIDPGTWQRVQRPIHEAYYTKLPALVVGTVRCAGCGYRMTPYMSSPSKRHRQRYLAYRCAKVHCSGTCQAAANIAAAKLEPYVLLSVLTILSRRRRRPTASLAEAEANAAAAAEALTRYRDNDRIARTIGQRAFLDGLAVRQYRLSDANLALADIRARADTYALPTVRELRRQLPGMTLDQKRDLVRAVIDAVFVTKGNGPAERRVMICPAGTAPRNLPKWGDHKSTMRTITPRRGWINPIRPGAA